jgi:hypothetical protein
LLPLPLLPPQPPLLPTRGDLSTCNCGSAGLAGFVLLLLLLSPADQVQADPRESEPCMEAWLLAPLLALLTRADLKVCSCWLSWLSRLLAAAWCVWTSWNMAEMLACFSAITCDNTAAAAAAATTEQPHTS